MLKFNAKWYNMNKNKFEIISFLKHIFNIGIESIKPTSLINNLSFENNLTINRHNIHLSENVYIVGFGKAALGFLNPLYKNLKPQFRRGIFSVPKPTEFEIRQKPELFLISNELKALTSVFYGSRSNIPNVETHTASKDVYNLIKSLGDKDTLIVVITGGGSALLCLPDGDITLQDVVDITTLLAKAGADIFELNAVRRSIDILKGGGMSLLCNANNIVSLILSDVIGDDISIIASGPTVVEDKYAMSPLDVLSKFNLLNTAPARIINHLQSLEYKSLAPPIPRDKVYNFVIGNNKMAFDAMSDEIEKIGLMPFILTTGLNGDCQMRSEQIVQFLEILIPFMANQNQGKKIDLHLTAHQLLFNKAVINSLIETISKKITNKGICLFIGGETPVTIEQSTASGGIGGRCSHMALSVACLMEKSILKESPVTILFGASDGMDGATDYAGAIAFPQLCAQSKLEKMEPATYLKKFDSYNFFKKFSGGQYCLETGMTGTNVMDFIIVVIPNEI